MIILIPLLIPRLLLAILALVVLAGMSYVAALGW